MNTKTSALHPFFDVVMRVQHRTVSPVFRDTIKQLIPHLGENQSYWSFLCVLLFGMREETTGLTKIPYELIALCENKEELAKTRNYVARQFLEEFRNNIWYFEWSTWSFVEERCRVVSKIRWTDEIIQAVRNERDKVWKDSGRVYMIDGKPWNPYRQRKLQNFNYQEAMKEMEKTNVEIAKELIMYMNGLSVRTFQNLEKNMPLAIEVAKNQKDRDNQLDLLRYIEDEFKPLYKPVGSSARIYPFSENICMLQKDVRKALTKGWIECDLRSAQLAIAARLWNLPDVIQYLEEKNNIWTDLYKTFGIDQTENPEAKKYFKQALYAIMYGGGKNLITEILAPFGRNAFGKFLTNPIILILWNAREAQLAKISEQVGATDCFGRWLALSKENPSRSILAQLSQSMELLLLSDVIRLAIKEKYRQSFQVCLWQHDGFSVQIRNQSRKSCWINRIVSAVDKKAKELGVPTSLEVTNLSL